MQRRLLAGLAALLLHAPSARAETLSPEQAVERAAAENPSLRAAMHELTAARHGVTAEEGARLPTFFAGARGEYNERFNAARAGIVVNEDRTGVGQLGVRYRSPLGTDLEVGVQSSSSVRSTLINPAGTEVVSIGPNYSGQVYLTARQPLLRGAGSDGVLGPLRQARAANRQVEQERDRVASQLVLEVLTAYWELWFAEQAVAVQEQAEQLATQQLAQIRRRVEELGTAPRTDFLRFSAELAGIREVMLQARTLRQARAIELGRLLGKKPTEAVRLSVVADPPPEVALPSVEALSAQARERSSELRAMQAQVELARERVRVAENANAPRLDLLASGGMAGLWTDDDLPGLALRGGRPALGVMLGLELEVPLGTSRESGEASRARALLLATDSRHRALADVIAAEVASVHAEIELSEQRVKLASESADIALELAEAERKRHELGTATSLDVVIAQQNQRESELRRLRVIVDQAAARFRLDHQAGALLTRFAPFFRETSPS